jgi:hypothetical protein
MRIIVGIIMCVMGATSALASDESVLFEQLIELAGAEDSEAQYHVGMMFNNGIGVDRDPEEAFDWFLRSSAGGDPLGAYKVGCYYAGQFGVVTIDHSKALEYKLAAAEAGYSLAQSDVAVAYASLGNSEDAVRWWKKSAHQGYPQALWNLSVIYYKGEIVPRDMALAYAYLELFVQASGFGESEIKTTMIEHFPSELSAAELEKAREIISDWKALPTPLTLRAGEGIQAALKHVESAQ